MAWSLDKTLAVDFDNRRYFDTSNDGKYISFLNTSNTFKVYNTATGEDMGWDIPNCYFIRFKIINSPNTLGGIFLVAVKSGYYINNEDRESDSIILYKLESDVWIEKGSYQQALGWPPQQEFIGAKWYQYGRESWDDATAYETFAGRVGPTQIIESYSSTNKYIYVTAPTVNGYGVWHINVETSTITKQSHLKAQPFLVGSESLQSTEMFAIVVPATGSNIHILDLDKSRTASFESLLDTQDSSLFVKTLDLDYRQTEGIFHPLHGRIYKTETGGYKLLMLSYERLTWPIHGIYLHSFDYNYTDKTLAHKDVVKVGEIAWPNVPNQRLFYASESSSLTQISFGPQYDSGSDLEPPPLIDASHLNKTIHITDEGELEEVPELQKAYPSILFPELVREWTQIGENIFGESARDESGISVSVNSAGNIVAIGALTYNGGAGRVRVYQNIDGTWTQMGQDIDGEGSNEFGDQSGYSVSINSAGDIVAIGAPKNKDIDGSMTGHVRVYQYQSTSDTWTQIGQDIDGEEGGDHSGQSVSLNSAGNIVAIGAPSNDGNGALAGHVRVYQNIDGAWEQIGQDIDGDESRDQSGFSVSINSAGDILAIGAPQASPDDIQSAGYVRIYQYQSTLDTWAQIGEDIKGTSSPQSNGYSVSVNSAGNIVAIGSPNASPDDIQNSGHVQVYQNIDGAWTQIGGDIKGKIPEQRHGSTVSINSAGNIVAIGSPNASPDDIQNSGWIWVYQYQSTSDTWKQIGQDLKGKIPEQGYGRSISINSAGNILVVGAPSNDEFARDAGATRVYSISIEEPMDFPTRMAEFREDPDLTISKYGPIEDWDTSKVTNMDGAFKGMTDITRLDLSKWDTSKVTSMKEMFYNCQALTSLNVSTWDTSNVTDMSYMFAECRALPSLNVKLWKTENVTNMTAMFYFCMKLTEFAPGQVFDLRHWCVSKITSSSQFVDLTPIPGLTDPAGAGLPKWGEDCVPFTGLIEPVSAGDTVLQIQESDQQIFSEGDSIVIDPGTEIEETNQILSFGSLVLKDPLQYDHGADAIISKFEVPMLVWTQIGDDIDGAAAGDESGWSTSLNSDGTIVAIGAPFHDDDSKNDAGMVRVYQNISGTWTQMGQDIKGEVGNTRNGYSVSLSSDGNILAIGANLMNSLTGYVRIFEYQSSSNNWTQIGQDIEGEAVGDESGHSVSLNQSGTIVAIGALRNDDNGQDSGHVRVYQYQSTSDTWTKMGQDIDGEAIYDNSGRSVSLNSDGTVVAIGAPQNNNIGHVRVYGYQNSSETWVQIGQDIEGITRYASFGWSTSLSSDGTVVVIGSGGDLVRVYQYNSGNWEQIGEDSEFTDIGSASVSLSSDGTIVAIGSWRTNSRTGRVRVYQNNGGAWAQIGESIDGEAANDRSGYSISLSSDGTVVAIGAPQNNNIGHVRVYEYK